MEVNPIGWLCVNKYLLRISELKLHHLDGGALFIRFDDVDFELSIALRK